MHDGGMYIAIGRIRAVRCVLPVTQRTDLPPELGMRHSAALGLAEKTDALIIVVSEETGIISIAMDGQASPWNCRTRPLRNTRQRVHS